MLRQRMNRRLSGVLTGVLHDLWKAIISNNLMILQVFLCEFAKLQLRGTWESK